MEQRPGIGIDAHGGNVVDPTKNVLDLTDAESLRQDGLREALEKYQDGMRVASDKYQEAMRGADRKLSEFENRLQNWMRDSESTRIDQLANLRQVYETRIAEMLAKSVESTSNLVSTQLVQIQATFNERVSKLEQFRWESGGRSSVADPAIADALTRMSATINALGTATGETMAKIAATNAEAISKLSSNVASIGALETKGSATRMGQGQLAQWVVMGIMMLAAVGSTITSLIALRGRP